MGLELWEGERWGLVHPFGDWVVLLPGLDELLCFELLDHDAQVADVLVGLPGRGGDRPSLPFHKVELLSVDYLCLQDLLHDVEGFILA